MTFTRPLHKIYLLNAYWRNINGEYVLHNACYHFLYGCLEFVIIFLSTKRINSQQKQRIQIKQIEKSQET